MTVRIETDRIPVAHDGDWYYLVDENDIERALVLAEQVRNRRTRVGRYLAARQLKSVLSHEIDVQIDDTDELYAQSIPYTAEELSAEILKTADL